VVGFGWLVLVGWFWLVGFGWLALVGLGLGWFLVGWRFQDIEITRVWTPQYSNLSQPKNGLDNGEHRNLHDDLLRRERKTAGNR
jgi:hypothetical protein